MHWRNYFQQTTKGSFFSSDHSFTDQIDQIWLDSVSVFENIPRLHYMVLSNIDGISVQE